MSALRHHLLRRRALAGLLVALALAMKLLVPSGYMIGASAGPIMVEICTGTGPQKMVMAIPGTADRSDRHGSHGKAEMPCAFAGLTAPSLAAADPLLLAAAIGFILLTVFRIAAKPAPSRSRVHLRPPLRGPPAHA